MLRRLTKMTDQVKCMQRNGFPFNVDGGPKWWFVFEKTAKQLAVRPTTDVVLGMEFLSRRQIRLGVRGVRKAFWIRASPCGI